jgi:hypothetical protein
MSEHDSKYEEVMERTGFYHKGRPVPSLIETKNLRPVKNEYLEKYVKYCSVVESDKLSPTSIFELSGSPCIYFTHLPQRSPSSRELSEIRRVAWNQGLAPLLWVLTPEKVLIYNCYSKPTRDDDSNPDRHVVDVFEQTEEGLRRLNEFAGRIQIESGRFWQDDRTRRIDRRERVDESLLKDLSWAERKLTTNGLPPDIAHALLGRSIFIAYLQDRGILSPRFFRTNFGGSSFVDVLETKTRTYELFHWIRRTFNGSLFPLARKRKSQIESYTVREQDVVKPSDLRIVRDLMAGTEMESGQGRLWPYDFKVIPVELISSIYEQFAYSDDPKGAKRRSTHYTPVNLVDLVLSEVFEGLSNDAKIADISCGSGVFLVESLRRLVAYRTINGEKRNRKLIRNTLHNQIYGVDVSREAIHLAAFSLYLTALELDPDPQPPSALRFKPLVGRNLFVADAFDEKSAFNRRAPFANKSLGAIVGNPPWKSAKKSDNQKLVDYCKKRQHPLARNTADQAFMWRAGDLVNAHARIGLILHSKPFFAHTPSALKARKALLSRFTPKVIFNLSDLRQERLFPRSVAPALIMVAECRESNLNSSFMFISPQRSEAFRRHGILEIGSEHLKKLRACRAASDPDILKVASWASARDFELIQSLRSSFSTLKDFLKTCNCKAGQGFQTAGGSEEAPELYDMKYLPPGSMPRYQIETDQLELLPQQGLHRPRDIRIYQGPLVVTTRGLSRRGFAAALSKKNVVYSESYYGISFSDTPPTELGLAHYMNGLLNSYLASYFLFLTSSVWGVERDEVRKEDLWRLPVPMGNKYKPAIRAIIQLEGRLREVDSASERTELEKRLNTAIYDLYELDDAERTLVEDVVDVTIDLRMRGKESDALDRPSALDMEAYASKVIDVVKSYTQASDREELHARVLDVGNAPLCVIEFGSEHKHKPDSLFQVVPNQDLETVLESIAKQLPHALADKVYSQRVLRIYADDDLYVVKPAQRRHWSRSAGLSDGDAILAEHIEDHDFDYTNQQLEGWPAGPTQTAQTR